MPYYVIYRVATGDPVSETSDPALISDPLRAGLAVKEFAQRPLPTQMWDAATLDFLTRPAKVFRDVTSDLWQDPDLTSVVGRLNAQQRLQVEQALKRVYPTHDWQEVVRG